MILKYHFNTHMLYNYIMQTAIAINTLMEVILVIWEQVSKKSIFLFYLYPLPTSLALYIFYSTIRS